jgi:DNA-directed RNA polymerase specialized sigma24 family protein
MDELNEQVSKWIEEACQVPRDGVARKKAITRIIATMQRSGKIWRGYGSDRSFYEDALHDTWLWFVKHLDEYDPDKGTVLAWFNTHLKYRLMDARIQWAKEQRMRSHPQFINGEWLNPLDIIPDDPDPPPMLDAVLGWMESNQIELRRIHMRDRPKVNCYVVILHRLPFPETYLKWEQLSSEVKVPVSALSSFYQKHCLPRLLAFGRSQGYLP